MPGPQDSFALMLLAAATLAVASGLPAFILYRQSRDSPLLPPFSSWAVPWNGGAVFLAFLAFIIVALIVVPTALGEFGFFSMLYGSDFPPKTLPGDRNDSERAQAAHLRGLWNQAIAIPIAVALISIGISRGTRASPSQMGLARVRIKSNLALGYAAWLALTPLAFGAFILAIATVAPTPDKHPLMDLGPRAGRRELILFAVQAAIFAPIVEELLFRGLLLPWLAQPPRMNGNDPDLLVQPRFRSNLIFAAALLLAGASLIETISSGQWNRVFPLPPALIFILLLAPIYFLLPLSERIWRWTALPSARESRAVFASSALFAAIHSNVWPSPVPLFVLGLGMGWLALRTRSIVPSIVVHALFNAIAVVYLLFGGQS